VGRWKNEPANPLKKTKGESGPCRKTLKSERWGEGFGRKQDESLPERKKALVQKPKKNVNIPVWGG